MLSPGLRLYRSSPQNSIVSRKFRLRDCHRSFAAPNSAFDALTVEPTQYCHRGTPCFASRNSDKAAESSAKDLETSSPCNRSDQQSVGESEAVDFSTKDIISVRFQII
jgi:hypothetical protein